MTFNPFVSIAKVIPAGIPNQEVKDGSGFASVHFRPSRIITMDSSLPVYEGLILLGKAILSFRAILEELDPNLEAATDKTPEVGNWALQGAPVTSCS